ncbi:MAG: EfeM/EfeO family lipoprotein [Myxococcota bacterium]
MRVALLLLVALACGENASAPSSLSPSEQATRDVKTYVDENLTELVRAVRTLCDAAPAPDEDGWSMDADADAVTGMRDAWRDARAAYERIEGAIAILFPGLDRTLDGRYEHHIALRGDPDLFDDQGFTGMHAVERILWSNEITPEVARFEEALSGYVEARTPATAAEATSFREGLCGRLVRDAETMQRQFGPLALDPQTAWRGIQGSLEEQAEKVALAATGQDESRYAQQTLADMRANLVGGRAVLNAYAPVLAAHPEAQALRPQIDEGFESLGSAYGEGVAIPGVPEGFDPDEPSEAHIATPYGSLFRRVAGAVDPRADGSLAYHVRRAGDAMGIPPLGR